ncbi:MAG: hypothetical protein ABI791_01745 [Acidobacteriota bacterium]
MKKLFFVAVFVLSLVSAVLSQGKPNDAISRQISELKSEKTFTLTADPGGNSSKLMAVAENFSDREAGDAGLMAMNFATGFFYAGTALDKSPERVMLTFWAMSKKPRFAENHEFSVFAGQEVIVIGNGRYSAKARENMEYLNYEISREELAKIAAGSNVRFSLGGHNFTFTRQHLKIIADLLLLSDVPAKN